MTKKNTEDRLNGKKFDGRIKIMKTESKTKTLIGFRVGDKRFDTLEEAKSEFRHVV